MLGPKPDTLRPREGPQSVDAEQTHAKEELTSAMRINFSNVFQAPDLGSDTKQLPKK